MPVSRAYAQRRWPRGYDAPAPHPGLMATFPPRFAIQARSRLDLLLACRQVYTEAWRLYYSTKHFDFGTAASMLQFVKKSIPARCRALTSVGFSCSSFQGSFFGKVISYLTECDDLRELTLVLGFHDECQLEALGKLRGLRKVDIRVLRQPRPGATDSEVQWYRREVEGLNQLLLRPKKEV